LGDAAQPAYAGRACFGTTMRTEHTAGLNRTARLTGRATPRHYTVIERPREDWIDIGVPALVAEDTWERVQRRLADNKRYASRNSTNSSLLQGICVCASCGYAYYRTSTRTTNKIIYYYRCLGSDNYRYQHGRVCTNKPVRADHLDAPRLGPHRHPARRPDADSGQNHLATPPRPDRRPRNVQRQLFDTGLSKATEAIKLLIGAYQKQLITRDELRSRMPELRNRGSLCRHRRSREVLENAATRDPFCRPMLAWGSYARSRSPSPDVVTLSRSKGGSGSVLRRNDSSASLLVGCRRTAEKEMPEVR
jgi:site-specific DNA recombinase